VGDYPCTISPPHGDRSGAMDRISPSSRLISVHRERDIRVVVAASRAPSSSPATSAGILVSSCADQVPTGNSNDHRRPERSGRDAMPSTPNLRKGWVRCGKCRRNLPEPLPVIAEALPPPGMSSSLNASPKALEALACCGATLFPSR